MLGKEATFSAVLIFMRFFRKFKQFELTTLMIIRNQKKTVTITTMIRDDKI